jgi:dsRNA-specific ribonuclease
MDVYEQEARLDRVMVILGYNFQTPSLLSEALHVAGSVLINSNGRSLKEGNKPLAGIGDRIISLYITEDAFNKGLTIGLFHNAHSRYGIVCSKLMSLFAR